MAPSSVSFELNEIQHHVQTDKHGRFECPCSHHQGVALYLSQNDLLIHIELVQKLTRSHDSFIFLAPDLLETPRLVHYALAVNTRYRLLTVPLVSICSHPMSAEISSS